MTITVYVIRSLSKNFRYIGLTDSLDRRLGQHNDGRSKSTSPYKPFKLIYSEVLQDRKLARQPEKFLKSGVGRNFLNSLES